MWILAQAFVVDALANDHEPQCMNKEVYEIPEVIHLGAV